MQSLAIARLKTVPVFKTGLNLSSKIGLFICKGIRMSGDIQKLNISVFALKDQASMIYFT